MIQLTELKYCFKACFLTCVYFSALQNIFRDQTFFGLIGKYSYFFFLWQFLFQWMCSLKTGTCRKHVIRTRQNKVKSRKKEYTKARVMKSSRSSIGESFYEYEKVEYRSDTFLKIALYYLPISRQNSPRKIQCFTKYLRLIYEYDIA